MSARDAIPIRYRKVLGFAGYVKGTVTGVDWIWIDTCCIDQDSSLGVSEAVNSVFKWYRGSEICIAYLQDVTTAVDLDEMRDSQWFRGGWTLTAPLCCTPRPH